MSDKLAKSAQSILDTIALEDAIYEINQAAKDALSDSDKDFLQTMGSYREVTTAKKIINR